MAAPYPDLTRAVWRKSSRSSSQGQNCVEVASNLPGIVAVRDSKDPDGGVLVCSREGWRAFTRGIKAGEFGGRARWRTYQDADIAVYAGFLDPSATPGARVVAWRRSSRPRDSAVSR